MKAVAYIRVSTREQDETVQLRAIREFAQARGIEVLKVYPDKGESGGKPFRDRPQAQLLLKELDVLKPDAIIAWSLDRLGRTMLDTLNTVLFFEEKGVKVITVREEWLQTLDGNIRRLILSVLSWAAEFERQRIRERQQEAWRQGKQKGRPPSMQMDEVRRYVMKYPELAKHDKKALWLVVRGDGHKVSYSRFVRKVNQVLKELGWW